MHLSPCGKRNRKIFQNFGKWQKTLARKWITTVLVQNLSRYTERGYGKNDHKKAKKINHGLTRMARIFV
jgi:hypothetical protein